MLTKLPGWPSTPPKYFNLCSLPSSLPPSLPHFFFPSFPPSTQLRALTWDLCLRCGARAVAHLGVHLPCVGTASSSSSGHEAPWTWRRAQRAEQHQQRVPGPRRPGGHVGFRRQKKEQKAFTEGLWRVRLRAQILYNWTNKRPRQWANALSVLLRKQMTFLQKVHRGCNVRFLHITRVFPSGRLQLFPPPRGQRTFNSRMWRMNEALPARSFNLICQLSQRGRGSE